MSQLRLEMEELLEQYPDLEGIGADDTSDLNVVREIRLPLSEEESDRKLDIFRISTVK